MSPKALMWIGGATFAVASLIEIVDVPGTFIPVAVFAFAGGGLFGKGYGIYEERSRKRKNNS